MAAPLGPPPRVATTWIFPSGVTRESVRRSISTRMTEPSGIATGPSGKRSPDVICVTFGVIDFRSTVVLLKENQRAKPRHDHVAVAPAAALVRPREDPLD